MNTLLEYFVDTLSGLYFDYRSSYIISDALRDENRHDLAEWYVTERAKWLAQQGTLMDVASVIGFDVGSISDAANTKSESRFADWLVERAAR